MFRSTLLMIPVAVAALLSAGCFTKFYRPGMEQTGRGPYDQIYDRYDSTAIDTTLTSEAWETAESYPERYDSWSYWGRPRGYTRWGFDFNRFDPGYYWSYYGYNDYYGTPWWHSWYTDPWWYYGPGYTPGPGEPPSRRPTPRRDHDRGGGSYAQPPAPASHPVPSSTPAPPPADDSNKNKGDDNKRPGKRGR